MTKQENRPQHGKIHQDQPLLLEKLNELDMDTAADMCERLHEDAENALAGNGTSSGRNNSTDGRCAVCRHFIR
jgi:hypothetical protein